MFRCFIERGWRYRAPDCMAWGIGYGALNCVVAAQAAWREGRRSSFVGVQLYRRASFPALVQSSAVFCTRACYLGAYSPHDISPFGRTNCKDAFMLFPRYFAHFRGVAAYCTPTESKRLAAVYRCNGFVYCARDSRIDGGKDRHLADALAHVSSP